jgi:hypothetical protein
LIRGHISNLLANPNISPESIEILKREAEEIEELARIAEFQDSNIAMKRGTESLSRNMRSRKPREPKNEK